MKPLSELYDLELGEAAIVEDDSLCTTALRVPGGWVFRSYDKSSGILSSAFVPFDNEFQNDLPRKPREIPKR